LPDIDLSVFTNMAKHCQGEPARRAERSRRWILELQDSFNALEEVRIPVLAAVQGGAIGGAVGGAVDMICASDIRYCTQDAKPRSREAAKPRSQRVRFC
jgi:enoyl-CoA hydratase